MAVSSQQVAVTSTATRLDISTDPQRRYSVAVTNRGTAAVYLGGSSAVTTSTGAQLDVGQSARVDLNTGDTLYAVAASGSHTCHVLQQGA